MFIYTYIDVDLINIIEISNNPYDLLSLYNISWPYSIRCVLKNINTLLKYVTAGGWQLYCHIDA